MVGIRMVSVGLVIPTYNGAELLARNLPIILKSQILDRILVIDSSSKDNTVDYVKSLGVQVLVIPQNEFNHGLTREKARKLLGTDIVVMMTQDAIPEDETTIEKLVAPLISGEASVSYAKQLPHHGADFFEEFPRQFNYPNDGHIRGIDDLDKYGPYTFFCSDSCAAWKNSALDEIGGFSAVLTGEDGVATAMLLKKGHKIAYVAEATVRHSHRYSLKDEFKRYFDTGWERYRFQDLFFVGGKDEKRGANFFKEMLAAAIKNNPTSVPYVILSTSAKFLGYKCGQYAKFIPKRAWKHLSSQPYFWNSKIGREISQQREQ